MILIGLTGPSGSGKGYIAKIISSLGFSVIDCDRIVHDLYSNPDGGCFKEIYSFFPACVEKDRINRKALGEYVFNDKKALSRLNSIVHKYVIEKVEMINSETEGFVFVDAPMLFESKLDRSCSFVISVVADKDIRIQRIIKRDGISPGDAVKRIKNQHTDRYFKNHSDYCIINNDDISKDQLTENVKRIIDDMERKTHGKQ